MAIDPKELRIGSHVNANGVRAKVIDIHNKLLRSDCKYQIFMEGISPEDGEKKVVGSMVDDLQPIPITEELLTGFGFCKKIIDSYWSMLTKDVDSFSISVGIQNHICKGVEIRDNDDKDAMFGWISPCKYLHELESFYYHCIGKELIND